MCVTIDSLESINKADDAIDPIMYIFVCVHIIHIYSLYYIYIYLCVYNAHIYNIVSQLINYEIVTQTFMFFSKQFALPSILFMSISNYVIVCSSFNTIKTEWCYSISQWPLFWKFHCQITNKKYF